MNSKKLASRASNLLILSISILVISILTIIYRQKSNSLENDKIDLKEEQVISGSFDLSKTKTKAEWRKILSEEQYNILQEGGTEIPFTGALTKENRPGTYYSYGCDVPLFRSESKYDSGTGWPSFTAPISPNSVVLRVESRLEGGRVEVLDPCGGHLGHIFDDGPAPTGKRYCMNSAALRFVPDKQ